MAAAGLGPRVTPARCAGLLVAGRATARSKSEKVGSCGVMGCEKEEADEGDKERREKRLLLGEGEETAWGEAVVHGVVAVVEGGGADGVEEGCWCA